MNEADVRHIHTLLTQRDEANRLLDKVEISIDLFIQTEQGTLHQSLTRVSSNTFRDFLFWRRDRLQEQLNNLGIR